MNFLNSFSNFGKSFFAQNLTSRSWVQLGADIYSEGSGDKIGYSVSINANGNIIAAGAPLNGSSDIGHVRIYSWDGAAWTQLGLDIDGEATNDQSGYSVSMNAAGDRVAIGAPFNSANGTSSGHTRIYYWNGSAWIQLGLDIDAPASFDQSGYSVSMSATGDIVAIGAPYGDVSEFDNRGIVRIYSWNGSAWTQLGADIPGRYNSDYLGGSVSISANGDRVVIGSHDYSGSVQIFQLT